MIFWFCFILIKVLVSIIPKFLFFLNCIIKFFPILLIMNSNKLFFLHFDFNLIFQCLNIIFYLFVLNWNDIINIWLVILKMYIREHLKFLRNLFKRSFKSLHFILLLSLFCQLVISIFLFILVNHFLIKLVPIILIIICVEITISFITFIVSNYFLLVCNPKVPFLQPLLSTIII